MTLTELPIGRAGALLEVDVDAIVDNWQLLCKRHRGGEVAAVVKADAYGLGATAIAPQILRAGCRHFFVATLDEGVSLRPLLPDATIAVLNGLAIGAADEYVAYDLLPVLSSLAEIAAWTELAREAGRRLPAMLHIDTGMARLGLPAREIAVLQQDWSLLQGIELRAVMTHLASAECAGDPLNAEQLRRFAFACGGLPVAPRSVANSSGIFLGSAWHSDLARPGAALYGINPTPGDPNPMRSVVRLLARVLQVRELNRGESVGYNATWRADRPARIATVGVGYADGWHRSLSNRGAACFDGKRLPLVGRVSMDLTTYDITDGPEIGPGAFLELMGPAMPPDEVAQAASTNGYEVLTSLGRRFARRYRCTERTSDQHA
jgi:alanine racemase